MAHNYMLSDPALRHGEGITHIFCKKGVLELEPRKGLRAGRYVVLRRFVTWPQSGRLHRKESFNIFQNESEEFIAAL